MRRDDAYKLMAERLPQVSLEHCLRVEALAVELGTTYHLDLDKCHLAGLVHDFARPLSHDELLAEARRLGIEVTEYEERNPYLLHGRVGAEALRADHGLNDHEVLRAIESHTLGRPDMTTFDAVILLADHLEPGRPKSYIPELRRLAEEDLWKAVRMCLGKLICRVIEQGKLVHPMGIDTLNALIRREAAERSTR